MYRKFLSGLTLTLLVLTFALPQEVRADTVTCNDGSVHAIPGTDYACIQPGEGGVRSVAPDNINSPGEICPTGFPRSGQAIPDGEDGTWCFEGGSGSVGEPKFVKNDCNSTDLNKDNCGIVRYLLVFINVLSGLVGVVVIAMVIVGGIQYSTAQDNPNAMSAAKGRIANALLALLVYIFMFAFLQWLVPGGLF